MEFKKNKLLVYLSYFFILSISAKASYWGLSYKDIGAVDTTESAQVFGVKSYSTVENGLGGGLGGYISFSPIKIETDDSDIEDEVSLQYIGVYLVKKIFMGSSYNISLVPNLFYGRGDIFVERTNTSNNEIVLDEESHFTILEPGVGIEFSVSDSVRFEINYSISSIYDTDLTNHSGSDFGGYTITFSVITGASPYDYAVGSTATGSLFQGLGE